MFESTIAVWTRTKKDIKNLIFPCQFVTHVVIMLYFIYAIFSKTGYFWANIPLFAITVFNFVFFLVTENKDKKEEHSIKSQKNIKKVLRRVKIAIKFLTLGATLYGLYITTTNVSVLSVILTALMLVGWVLSVVLELVSAFVMRRIDVLIEAAMHDVEFVINILDFVKKIGNKKSNTLPIPNEHEDEIAEMVEEYMQQKGIDSSTATVTEAIAVAQSNTPKKKWFGRNK